jgi:preprotein translocase subunit SecE
MSAQRRTANKRDTATSVNPPRRAAGNGPRPVPAAAAAVAPPRPAPQQQRPPKPTAERGRATPAERNAWLQRVDALRRVYADSLAEMKKINWPDRETTKNLTIVVLGISIVLAILLGGIDFLLQRLFEVLP